MKPHEPMLNYIRKNVKKPDYLPYFVEGALRFVSAKCPMGLLPCSTFPTPFDRQHFAKTFPKYLTLEKIRGFAYWWDRQKDAEQAVEAVWGKK